MLPDAWQPWFTSAVLLGLVGLLMTGRFGADIVFMGALTALVIAGTVDASAAISGFANPGVITVALLYVVATGMKQTGAMNLLTARLIGRPKTLIGTQVRLVLPVAGLSAFVNNTPIVAMFLPVLSGIAKRGGFSASKLFMPLSFASILGGVCTLIGTSTNVIVAGLLISNNITETAADGTETPVRIGMFTLAAVGLPITIAGIAYMLIFGRKLLPDQRGDDEVLAADAAQGESREYMTAMRVQPDSSIAGRTVEQAGLRHLPGLFLSRIDRMDSTIIAAGPDEEILAGDVLVFVGDLDSVVDLQQIRGLEPVSGGPGEHKYRPSLQLVEAVVSTSSQLVGQTVRGSGIRTKYAAVIVAVHRRGHRLRGKIGDIRLLPGDTLLLEVEKGFVRRHRNSRDFYLLKESAQTAALRYERAWIALTILAALVVSISVGWLEPLPAAMLAGGAMIITRCCTGPQAREGVDWPVLITIGTAFGVGSAIEQTGLADSIALAITDAVATLGPWAPMAAVYLLTVVFTMVMTNNAAAVLMFPIGMTIAAETGVSPLAYAVIIAIAASCEFSTPIGYQTNLMVMGPGGYRWLDFTRFGGPLTLLAAIICIILAPLVYA